MAGRASAWVAVEGDCTLVNVEISRTINVEVIDNVLRISFT